MIYTVEIAEQAAQDLRDIYEYIAFVLQSPQNAAAQIDRLEENIFSLDHMPERYRRYDRDPWMSRGWRIMIVDNYCVFYAPDHSRKVVNVTRVIYGSRDLETTLSGEKP